MRAVDPDDLPEPEHFSGTDGHIITVEIGERLANMLVFWSLIFVGLVIGGVIG